MPKAQPGVNRARLGSVPEHVLIMLAKRIADAREQLDSRPDRISEARIGEPV